MGESAPRACSVTLKERESRKFKLRLSAVWKGDGERQQRAEKKKKMTKESAGKRQEGREEETR